MTDWTEYAVYRFLDKNGYSHMVSDYAEGTLLIRYKQIHLSIDKSLFIRWIGEMMRQTEQYHSWKKGKAYGYITPFSFLVTENKDILLIDPEEQVNAEIIKKIQKRTIRELFVKKSKVVSQNMEPSDDLYGLGKTIEYLINQWEMEASFTRKEKRIADRIVKLCLGTEKGMEGRTFADINRELRKLSVKKSKKSIKKRLFAGLLLVVVLVGIAAGIVQGRNNTVHKEQKEREKDTIEEVKREEKEQTEELTEGYLKLGLVYFVEVEDYEKSAQYFEKIEEQSELGNAYLSIVRYMQNEERGTYTRRELEGAVNQGEAELEKREIKEDELLFQYPFLESYARLDTTVSAEKVIQIGEHLIQTEENAESIWSRKGRKIKQYLANAYEKTDKTEYAIQIYEEMKEMAEEKELENIYVRLEELYEKNEAADKSWEVCRESVEQCPESEKLWIRYVEKHCADNSIERTSCAEAVKKALKALPELLDNTEFQKLQKAYDIKIEGEEIWVGKSS